MGVDDQTAGLAASERQLLEVCMCVWVGVGVGAGVSFGGSMGVDDQMVGLVLQRQLLPTLEVYVCMCVWVWALVLSGVIDGRG
jgi:hypothetical protein